MQLLFSAGHTTVAKKKFVYTFLSSRQNTVNGASGLSPSGTVADFFHHLVHLIVIIYTSCCGKMVLCDTKIRMTWLFGPAHFVPYSHLLINFNFVLVGRYRRMAAVVI
jgi:hypothetical protein